MKTFKQFLEASIPTTQISLNPPPGFEMPNLTGDEYQSMPKNFQDLAYEKIRDLAPKIRLYDKLSKLVWNIANEPKAYGSQVVVQGTPSSGGIIKNVELNKMKTLGQSRGHLFNPVELYNLGIDNAYGPSKSKIIQNSPSARGYVDINMGELYKEMDAIRKQIKGTMHGARGLDQAVQAVGGLYNRGIQPGVLSANQRTSTGV